MSSFVYFIKPVGMDGPIKIGCSKKPIGRLLTLSAWSPFTLEIIGWVPGTFADEGRLHRKFSELHTRREWFMSSPLLRQTIERILAGESIKDACKEIAEKNSIRNQKRPARTPDRVLFLKYGHAVRKAVQGIKKARPGHGRWRAPDSVCEIMHNWRSDRYHGHNPVTPTQEQFALLDRFIADPDSLATFMSWERPELVEQQAAA